MGLYVGHEENEGRDRVLVVLVAWADTCEEPVASMSLVSVRKLGPIVCWIMSAGLGPSLILFLGGKAG